MTVTSSTASILGDDRTSFQSCEGQPGIEHRISSSFVRAMHRRTPRLRGLETSRNCTSTPFDLYLQRKIRWHRSWAPWNWKSCIPSSRGSIVLFLYFSFAFYMLAEPPISKSIQSCRHFPDCFYAMVQVLDLEALSHTMSLILSLRLTEGTSHKQSTLYNKRPRRESHRPVRPFGPIMTVFRQPHPTMAKARLCGAPLHYSFPTGPSSFSSSPLSLPRRFGCGVQSCPASPFCFTDGDFLPVRIAISWIRADCDCRLDFVRTGRGASEPSIIRPANRALKASVTVSHGGDSLLGFPPLTGSAAR